METTNHSTYTGRRSSFHTELKRIIDVSSSPRFTDKRKGKVIKYRIKIAYNQATDQQIKAIKELPHVVRVENVRCTSAEGHTYPSICIWLDCNSIQSTSI